MEIHMLTEYTPTSFNSRSAKTLAAAATYLNAGNAHRTNVTLVTDLPSVIDYAHFEGTILARYNGEDFLHKIMRYPSVVTAIAAQNAAKAAEQAAWDAMTEDEQQAKLDEAASASERLMEQRVAAQESACFLW